MGWKKLIIGCLRGCCLVKAEKPLMPFNSYSCPDGLDYLYMRIFSTYCTPPPRLRSTCEIEIYISPHMSGPNVVLRSSLGGVPRSH
ncbi:hypothetical protein F4819DRAFT_360420 [Hypoxylon fuscum]|nr:hypothetical protein F4819DRAFT_360420 [Hypoxylon fuscum]